MTKWELARYLIDAKKSIDTILYLAQNAEQLSMLDIRSKINETKRSFYVNACVILDKCFPKKKKEICGDALIGSVYYERDKNFAHKDDNYAAKQYASITDIANEMKQQLEAVLKLCADHLPDCITLDYLPFDSLLYRMANGITKEREEEALDIKHPGRLRKQLSAEEHNAAVYSVFSDTEDIRNIPAEKRKEYATVFQTGIVMEETLQRLQDNCIRTNVLNNLNMWVVINPDKLAQITRMRELGLVDKCDVPTALETPEEWEKLMVFLKEVGIDE